MNIIAFPFNKEFFKSKKNTAWFCVYVVAFIIFIISLIWLIIYFLPDKNKFDDFKTTSSGEEVVLVDNPINFSEIWQTNPEVCAWIQVDGTVIDYPILQSSTAETEDFYLDHDLERKPKKAGSIYIQRLNNSDFSDRNTLIYGHNMLNGTMFGTLKKFRNKEFFDQNRYIYVYTPKKILKYSIASAFVYDDRHILNSFNFQVDRDYQDFIDDVLNPASLVRQIAEGVEISTDDKIITLSTCTSVETERYLVVGVLEETILTK